MPGKAGRAYRAGDNLAERSGVSVGSGSWEDFLARASARDAVAQPAA
jgi:hypothetical protein